MASFVFTPGDLVVSVSGDGDGSGTYTDNQASPITLEEFSTTGGAAVGTLVLPQTTTTVNGVTENAISGEYGSSSEGSLQLSADGQSLTIAGYGINASTFNTAEASGGTNAYGNAALAQTTSLGNSTSSTPVSRVIADIRYDGTIDTSTALFNVDNTNNPRSVATVDGSSFVLSGQGVKGDTTQGVQAATDGASSATIVNDATDTRTAEIYGGNLYVSTDSKQGSAGFTANIAEYSGIPTGAATPTILPGISQSVTLSAGQGNGISSTGKINLSPENFFFANATTLYVADGGQPKGGGLGDGGLQKWTFANGTWSLQYTLSSGLNLVANTASAGTTGLIGLTGKTNGDGTVSLYATNSTKGDTDPTYLYGINDTIASTTGTGESFTQLEAAAPDTNIRGVAFAPQAAACYCTGTPIRTVSGDVAVEALQVGDLVVTTTGEHRPIRWIGRQTVDCRGSAPDLTWPIRVRAHAFARNRPSSDLWLSPGHAVCVDLLGEILVPIGELVNGATIVQEPVDAVTYWHVELDSHDVLLANNMPAESYLDVGNRGFFVAGIGAPDGVAKDLSDCCRPFVHDPMTLAMLRARLRTRAEILGWRLRAVHDADLHLVVDGAIVRPEISGGTASFTLPADTDDVWLVSRAFVPKLAGSSADSRRLGVSLSSIVVADGVSRDRDIPLSDRVLGAGFHETETDASGRSWRWTVGRARLPAVLWSGSTSRVSVAIAFAAGTYEVWTHAAVETVDAPGAAMPVLDEAA